jgi:hypothetical protein
LYYSFGTRISNTALVGGLSSANLSISLGIGSFWLFYTAEFEMFGFISTGQYGSTQKIEDLMDMVKKLQKGHVSLTLRFEVRQI